ncbi:hypothetical protein BS50DRAFT_588079 [Corynespora cassiicola Philippines]|uniref:Uncharacterized protein n=1 Tax=Corynespora cassiicola Philippines TaxID=1448308 RepID=A0A2T2NP75_CORCC|nr:hypothetical protein BS50DRAFT_588079 [Corynespora cassiicola Philippines]
MPLIPPLHFLFFLSPELLSLSHPSKPTSSSIHLCIHCPKRPQRAITMAITRSASRAFSSYNLRSGRKPAMAAASDSTSSRPRPCRTVMPVPSHPPQRPSKSATNRHTLAPSHARLRSLRTSPIPTATSTHTVEPRVGQSNSVSSDAARAHTPEVITVNCEATCGHSILPTSSAIAFSRCPRCQLLKLKNKAIDAHRHFQTRGGLIASKNEWMELYHSSDRNEQVSGRDLRSQHSIFKHDVIRLTTMREQLKGRIPRIIDEESELVPIIGKGEGKVDATLQEALSCPVSDNKKIWDEFTHLLRNIPGDPAGEEVLEQNQVPEFQQFTKRKRGGEDMPLDMKTEFKRRRVSIADTVEINTLNDIDIIRKLPIPTSASGLPSSTTRTSTPLSSAEDHRSHDSTSLPLEEVHRRGIPGQPDGRRARQKRLRPKKNTYVPGRWAPPAGFEKVDTSCDLLQLGEYTSYVNDLQREANEWDAMDLDDRPDTASDGPTLMETWGNSCLVS